MKKVLTTDEVISNMTNFQNCNLFLDYNFVKLTNIIRVYPPSEINPILKNKSLFYYKAQVILYLFNYCRFHQGLNPLPKFKRSQSMYKKSIISQYE